MILRIITFIAAALVALLLAGGFTSGAGTAATASAQVANAADMQATTGNIPVIAINQEFCFILVAARGGPTPIVAAVACPGLQQQANLDRVASALAAPDPSRPQPRDFAGIDIDGNQVHQQDGFAQYSVAGSPGNLYIIAFVPDYGPVTFHTDRGLFQQPTGGDAAGPDWTCDTAAEDPDCVAGGSGGDGVVVARLRANDAIADLSTGAITTPATIIAPTGVGTATVTQSATDTASIDFRVVGEPAQISLITLENKLQDGITDPLTQCHLPGVAAALVADNALPEKSAVIAVAKDNDGTPVAGAIVNWTTSDDTLGVMAAPLEPTADLGSFGLGAPNVLCGTSNPGTVTVTGRISRDVMVGGATVLNIDHGAQPAVGTQDMTVVGVPASITLAADPATIPCDGTATSKVTATVLDAAGNTAAAGQEVRFDAQTLGTASPAIATTDANGAATSTITPNSGTATSLAVAASAGNAASSISISCAPPDHRPAWLRQFLRFWARLLEFWQRGHGNWWPRR